MEQPPTTHLPGLSEEILHRVMDSAPEGVVVCDGEGRFRLWNAAATRILGAGPKPIPPDQWSQHYGLSYDAGDNLMPADELPLVRALRGEAVDGCEILLRRPGHPDRWINVNARPVTDSQGELVGAVAVFQDTTQRREDEMALRRIEQAVNNIDDAVILTDADPSPKIIHVNNGFVRMTGYKGADVRGRSPRLLSGAATEPAVVGRLTEAIADGRQFKGQLTEYRRNGSEFIADLNVSPVRDPTRRIVNWVEIHRDVTDRRVAEQNFQQQLSDLAHANRVHTVGELATSIAHQLNQPLAAITNHAFACRRALDAPDSHGIDLNAALQVIYDQAQRAGEITRELRQLMRRHAPQRELTPINKLIDRVLNLLRIETERADITVHTELDDNLPDLVVDPVQIEQVLLNLVRNAVEAMAHHDNPRRLTVRSAADQHLRLSVIDTGALMTAQTLKHIFQPFYTTKQHGLGMGLVISRSIVERHQGRLRAELMPEGGAAFHVELPLPQRPSRHLA